MSGSGASAPADAEQATQATQAAEGAEVVEAAGDDARRVPAPTGSADTAPNADQDAEAASPVLARADAGVYQTSTRIRARTLLRKGYRGTLAETFKGRENGVGLLRFCLAMSVVVSHTRVLGFGGPDLLGGAFRNQQALGGLAVAGFFVLSGMLITRSARRTGFLRYAWHRCLRIFPGLWVCLAVTAFVVAPWLAMRQNGSLRGFWTGASGPGGPVRYVSANMWSGVQQYGIRNLLVQTTPWGRLTHGSAFDGPLWSLVYEMICYIVIGSLLITGVLRYARRFMPFLAVVLYLRIVMDFRLSSSWGGNEAAKYQVFYVNYLGYVDWQWITYLGFLFMAAGALELYREKVPVHDGLGALAAVATIGSLLFGGWFVIGYPAFVYLMVWMAVRAPRWTHWVGRKNDYSYGVYIYGFIGQQVMASLGWTRWGYFPYLLMSMGVAFAAAYLSWHLVEKHCLKLKNWTPRRPARWVRAVRARWVPAPRSSSTASDQPAAVVAG